MRCDVLASRSRIISVYLCVRAFTAATTIRREVIMFNCILRHSRFAVNCNCRSSNMAVPRRFSMHSITVYDKTVLHACGWYSVNINRAFFFAIFDTRNIALNDELGTALDASLIVNQASHKIHKELSFRNKKGGARLINVKRKQIKLVIKDKIN